MKQTKAGKPQKASLTDLAQTAATAQSLTATPEQTDLSERMNALRVRSVPTAETASELLAAAAAMRKSVEATFKPMASAAYTLHRSILAARNDLLRPLDEAEAALKKRLTAWTAAEERKAAERARKAAAEEAARQAALQESLAGQLEREGFEADEAAEIAAQDAAELAPPAPPRPPPMPPRIRGVTTRKTLTAQVTDIKALAGAVASGRVPPTVLSVNHAPLMQLIRAHGGTLQVPGVTIGWRRTTVRTSR